jgi:uncharacterized membrane protein YkoI
MKSSLALLMCAAAFALAGCSCCDKKEAPPPAKSGTAMMEVEEDEVVSKETPVALDKLPANIRAAAEAAAPGLVVAASSMEEEDGKTFYEVSGKVGDQVVEVILTPEGEVVVVERVISVDAVPANVRDAAVAKVPGLVIAMAEEIKRGGATQYELKGKANGKKFEVKLSEAGEVLELED